MVLNRIGITGAGGLIGSHLLPLLLKSNYKVIATSRKFSKNNKNLIYKKLDFSKKINNKQLEKIFGKLNYLIHTVAILPNNIKKNYNKLKTVNFYNTKKIIDWASKKKTFIIFFSTIFKPKKKNYYNLYKKKIETYLKNKTTNYLIIRPSSVYGHGLKDKSFLNKKIDEIKEKKKLSFYTPLDQELNFIHAHDVSRAILFLIINNKRGSYDVFNKNFISIKNVKKLLIEVFKISNKKVIIKNFGNKIYKNSSLYNKKIFRLGWNCNINLKDGIIDSFVKKKIII